MGSAWKKAACGGNRGLSSIKAPQCSWLTMCALILPPRPRLSAVAQTFVEHGLPSTITLDRDTRWVGAPQGSDFPAALVRFCHCLGVAVLLCDPHHPQQNGFVERYHRTLTQERLKLHRPKTLSEGAMVSLDKAILLRVMWVTEEHG